MGADTNTTPNVVGGLGEKKSNGNTQYFQQDRVYDSDHLAMCLPAAIPGGSYRYLIVEDFYSNRPIRVYKEYSPTIRSERIGLKVVEQDN